MLGFNECVRDVVGLTKRCREMPVLYDKLFDTLEPGSMGVWEQKGSLGALRGMVLVWYLLCARLNGNHGTCATLKMLSAKSVLGVLQMQRALWVMQAKTEWSKAAMSGDNLRRKTGRLYS